MDWFVIGAQVFLICLAFVMGYSYGRRNGRQTERHDALLREINRRMREEGHSEQDE